jgi:CheY-like chemotaxis protein
MVHAENGVKAINYMTIAKEEEALPCLVILDINMPVMDGKTTLAEMKKDEELSTLPVVAFSTSNNPMDKAYCNSYGVDLITKPSNVQNMKQEITRILQYCPNG